jgi:hypothetical protein
MEQVQSEQPVQPIEEVQVQENPTLGVTSQDQPCGCDGTTCSPLQHYHQTHPAELTRKYSAAGFVVTTPEGHKLVYVSYAVCSEKDTFSKKKANLITEGRLRKQKGYAFEVPEELKDASASAIFLNAVRTRIPHTVLPPVLQEIAEVKHQEENPEDDPTNKALFLESYDEVDAIVQYGLKKITEDCGCQD